MASREPPEDDLELDIVVVPQAGPAPDGRPPGLTQIRCLTPWCAPTLNCPPSRACG